MGSLHNISPFGELLTRYRQEAGLNKTKLSELLGPGFSIAYLSELERGRMLPPVDSVERERKLSQLADVLATAIAAKKGDSAAEAEQLKHEIYGKFESAVKRQGTPDVNVCDRAVRMLAWVLTGDPTNNTNSEFIKALLVSIADEEELHERLVHLSQLSKVAHRV